MSRPLLLSAAIILAVSTNAYGFSLVQISSRGGNRLECRACRHHRLHHFAKAYSGKHNGDIEKHASQTIDTSSVLSRAQTFVTTITLALILTSSTPFVQTANAGFGPSSGATTSPPPNLITPRIDNGDLMGNQQNKKLKQLIGSSLDENRLEQFKLQLDDLTESIKRLISEEDEESSPDLDAIQEREAELEKAQVLQQQILDREKILAQLEKQPYWFNYLAAFIGSVASTLVMHPIDTIKTRAMIASREEDDDDNTSDNESRKSNFLSLYDGLAGNIFKEAPPSALYLGVYESVKHFLYLQFGVNYRLFIYLAAGAAGEMVGSIVRAPAEAIKSTVQTGLASSTSDAALQIFGTESSRANVVRAWSASVWRDVPFGAIQLAIFELTKTYILNNPDVDFDSSTLLAEAIIGAFAGGWGALLTAPFDVITTRIITQDVVGTDDSEKEPLGVLEMMDSVYKEGGVGAFFVGWQARVAYWAPAISIFLSCYCSVRQAGIEYKWF